MNYLTERPSTPDAEQLMEQMEQKVLDRPSTPDAEQLMEQEVLDRPSTPDADMLMEQMEQEVLEERLRQARFSFNVALLIITVSASINFVGAGLLLSSLVSEGLAMTAGGIAGNVVSLGLLKLNKNANDRLDRMTKDLM